MDKGGNIGLAALVEVEIDLDIGDPFPWRGKGGLIGGQQPDHPVGSAALEQGETLLLIVEPDDAPTVEIAVAPLNAAQAANPLLTGGGPAGVLLALGIDGDFANRRTDREHLRVGLLKALDPGDIAIDGAIGVNQFAAAGEGAGDKGEIDFGFAKPLLIEGAQQRDIFDGRRQRQGRALGNRVQTAQQKPASPLHTLLLGQFMGKRS